MPGRLTIEGLVGFPFFLRNSLFRLEKLTSPSRWPCLRHYLFNSVQTIFEETLQLSTVGFPLGGTKGHRLKLRSMGGSARHIPPAELPTSLVAVVPTTTAAGFRREELGLMMNWFGLLVSISPFFFQEWLKAFLGISFRFIFGGLKQILVHALKVGFGYIQQRGAPRREIFHRI